MGSYRNYIHTFRQAVPERFKRAHWAFAVMATLFGLVFVFTVPPLWGLDEISHFNRLYHITEGQIVPQKGDRDHFGGFIPTNLASLDKYVYTDLTNNSGKPASGRKDVDSKKKYLRLLSMTMNTAQERSIATAEYSPVAYLGALVGAIAAKSVNGAIGTYIYLSRLTSLLFYVVAGVLALYILRNSKVKWLFFTVSLFPVCIFQAAVISADSMVMALSILLMAAFFRLVDSGKKTLKENALLLGLASVSAIALPLTKSNYVLFSFVILLIPLAVFASKRLGIVIKMLVAFVSVALAFVWSRIASVTSASPYTQRQDGIKIVPSDQIAFLLDNPFHIVDATVKSIINDSDSYLQSMATSLGWNSVPVSYVAGVLLIIALIMAASYAKPDLIRYRKRLFLLNGVVALAILGIFVALYVGFTPTGHGVVDGVQGRYFLPLLLPFIMLVTTFIPIKKIEFTQPMGVLLSSLLGVSFFISFIYCWLVYY